MGAGNPAMQQVVAKCRGVQLDVGQQWQERLYLRCEDQLAPAGQRIVERLDAAAIARQDPLAVSAVPEAEGEHAGQGG